MRKDISSIERLNGTYTESYPYGVSLLVKGDLSWHVVDWGGRCCQRSHKLVKERIEERYPICFPVAKSMSNQEVGDE
jgi:hypothetical protein